MRKEVLLAASTLLLVVIVLEGVPANPLIEGYLNELSFVSGNWIFEMNPHSNLNLQGWSLSSRTDSASFVPKVISSGEYALFTSEHLQSHFTINPLGDSLTLRSPQGVRMTLVFGSSQQSMVAAPAAAGQSISFNGVSYYLDNTPTLGKPNDTINACGVIRGVVRDEKGTPLNDVLVQYGLSWNPASVYTNANGEFSFCCLASRQRVAFTFLNFAEADTTIQAWPESTTTLTVTLRSIVRVDAFSSHEPVRVFEMSEPYPNPSNPSTSFVYALPQSGRVEISVFDVNGRLAERLYSGFQSSGRYRIVWNGEKFPSGIYIFRVQSTHFSKSRKCLLIK